MTLDEYRALLGHGILDRVELIDGRLVMGEFELALSPEQARAARTIGLEPCSYVDAVLEDALARAELKSRLDGR